MQSIDRLSDAFAAGRANSRDVTAEALRRIADPKGEGSRVFTRVYDRGARAQADAADRLREAGIRSGVLHGIPISIKDLFDVSGEPTTAGSIALKDAPPAQGDAAIVRRLRAAGAVIVGKTNMTEFAYSGIGWNPHYGTPRNPWDRGKAPTEGRIPGGSSSGAAISVSDDMAVAAIGTDTGGSVRIPAALCGLVGFKPTAARVPLDGSIPLSHSLDSIGPLARSVADCALIDAVLAGIEPAVPAALPVAGARLGVIQGYVMDNLDSHVAGAYQQALTALSRAGARLVDMPFDELLELPCIYAKGGLGAAEAYHWHRDLMAQRGKDYDPRVILRIKRGAEMSAADYLDVLAARTDLNRRADTATRPFDAVIMPTCPIVAPRLSEIARDEDFARLNILILRNTTVGNFLDRCAITLPCHEPGAPPVGLSLMGARGHDRRLLALAAGVEAALAR